MKSCPACHKQIPTPASVCPYCQTAFSTEQMATATRLSRTRGMVALAIVLGVGIALVKSCGI